MNTIPNILTVLTATLVLIAGSLTTLQAQDRDTTQQQQTEMTELIDRLDQLMDRALALAKDDEQDQYQTTVRDRQQDQVEGVETERETERRGMMHEDDREMKEKKHIKRIGEHLGMTLGNMKNTAERYEMLIQENGMMMSPDQQPWSEEEQETDEEQQEEEEAVIGDQPPRQNVDSAERQQSLDDIREHLTVMTDEMEKTIEAMEKLSQSGQDRFQQQQEE